MQQTPVLIVGAGLTWLSNALLLQKYGVPFRIIEKSAQPKEQQHLVQIQPRTAGMFAKLNLIQKILEKGTLVKEIKIHYQKKHITSLMCKDIAAHYPHPVMISYIDLRDIMHNSLKTPIDRDHALVDFKNKEKGTLCTIQTPGEKILMKTDIIIGADGPESVVRRQISPQQTTEKETYASMTFLARVSSKIELEEEPKESKKKKNEPDTDPFSYTELDYRVFDEFLAISCRDKEQRIQTTIVAKGDKKNEEQQNAYRKQYIKLTKKEGESIELFSRMVQPWSYRMTQNIQKRKAFVTGTAVAEWNDVRGQRLSNALYDAEQLSWRIAALRNHIIQPALLESYEAETKQYRVSNRTREKKYLKLFLDRGLFAFLLYQIALTTHWSDKNNSKFFLHHYAGLDEEYGESALRDDVYPSLKDILLRSNLDHISRVDAFHFARAPHVGQRAPSGFVVVKSNEPKVYRRRLSKGYKHLMLIFVGEHQNHSERLKNTFIELQQKYHQYFDTYVVTNKYDIRGHDGNHFILGDPKAELHKKYMAEKPCMYLVRPDGIIAWRSLGLLTEELGEYVKKVFG